MDASLQPVYTSYFDALRTGQLDVLAEMLDAVSQLAAARDTSGLSAVQTALYYEQHEALELLLRIKPELDLFDAAALGRAERIGELLDGGQFVDAQSPDGFTALQLAAHYGHLEVVRALLVAGADPSARDQHGDTPLHSAATTGNALLLGLLHQYGSDPETRNADNQTAEDVLTGNGYSESE